MAMKTRLGLLVLLAFPALLTWNFFGFADEPKAEVAFPHFHMQEIETGLKVGYAVLIADINNDGKPDIVVVDANRVVWYENPTWKRRTIIEGQTKPDNVCIAAYDIDGDGQIDLALGADWKPFNTKDGGTIQWLKRGKTLDDPWTVYPIGEEPTVHRIGFADIDGSGKPALIVAPLMGRNSTAKNNWIDGSPVHILAFRIPKDPTKDRWVPEVINESLYVVHNFFPTSIFVGKEHIRWDGYPPRILAASYEGVTELSRKEKQWSAKRLGDGNQENPTSNRGASEVALGGIRGGGGTGFAYHFIVTVEPWHGNEVVVYTQPTAGMLIDPPESSWHRYVIDERLKWGHAVACADLSRSGTPFRIGDSQQIIVGVRDNLSDNPGDRRGLRIYKALDERGTKWARHIVEDGGVAVESMAVADLNGDGRPDIVAAGRQTGNVRIYWNEGVKGKEPRTK
jgi:hypothetical protein